MELDFGTGKNVYLLGDVYYYPVNLAARTIPFVIYKDPAAANLVVLETRRGEMYALVIR